MRLTFEELRHKLWNYLQVNNRWIMAFIIMAIFGFIFLINGILILAIGVPAQYELFGVAHSAFAVGLMSLSLGAMLAYPAINELITYIYVKYKYDEKRWTRK